jgi:SulP family sulfate permease
MIVQLLPQWLAMVFVVAFCSCLDVAAIEMAQGDALDYNSELQTVGVSNIMAGITGGGFTGSYIFSQTIFNMKLNLNDRNSRLVGCVVVLCETLVFISPISITRFLPKCLFGALLTLIASDLLWEWLIRSRSKMLLREYITVWFTFIAIGGGGSLWVSS